MPHKHSDHSVSSNNSFKTLLNANSFNMFLTLEQLRKHDDSTSWSVAMVMWTYKGDVNSASGENWKEASSSAISAEASFNGDSNEETLNVNKTCWQ